MNYNTNKNSMELAGVKEDKYSSLKEVQEAGMINKKQKIRKLKKT